MPVGLLHESQPSVRRMHAEMPRQQKPEPTTADMGGRLQEQWSECSDARYKDVLITFRPVSVKPQGQ